MQHDSALATLSVARMTDETLAAEAFLGRYGNPDTADMYRADLTLFFLWCDQNGIEPLAASRVQLEFFSRHLEVERGNKPASVARRLSTLKGFYKIAVADDRIVKDPCQYLRVPKVIYDESAMMGLDRLELGRLITAARATSPRNAALVSLMGFLGLRVSEAVGIQVENFQDTIRSHRVLQFIGKGGKPATIPIPIPVYRDLQAAAGERTSGPLILRKDGKQMDRRTAYRRIKTLARLADLPDTVHPHTLRHSAITAGLDAGISLRDMQVFARHSDPRMTSRYDRTRLNLDRHASYAVASYLAGAA